ncbi:SDR family oxidoreductase [Actinoplanes sp. N902-109]|uniref:SDR family oxidoreductase n=1 Tax=Actinoplanes sp. (strain N902-109) TaxID=649831 RepID=UPI0003295270|nr:SDR family oxidoreductase [Actinoplanes sp. N902-109]AGL14978.1 short-chain dehydrogenase/reductase SDR [Actinoplanes sp. N902-109]
MTRDQFTAQDPRSQHPAPELKGGEQSHPGLTSRMPDRPDHGEETYRGSGRLTGKRAIITGGDSGIGRAVAIAFAREGADVLISYLPEEEDDAQETAQLIEKAGRTAVRVPGDIRDEAHCQAIVDRALSELGGLDILVNNAAFQMAQPGGITDITTEQFDRVMRTNLYAMFWLCRAAVPHLQPGATIINTASIQAYQSSSALLDYATTKGGIVAFTKALAEDLADKGIRVNAVAPGPVWTPLIPATMPSEKVASFGGDTPLGRAGQPAELAPAYVYFASQESSYTTGEVLGITGGKPVS